MIRDFSYEALELMLSYCNDYEEWCEEGAPEYQWDSSYTQEELDYYISNSTDAEVCMQYIDLYHQELIRSRDYTATTVEEIFQAVNDLDDGFSSVIASQTEAYYDPYISVIQGLINCLTKPEAGQSIMDAPSEFKKALDSVGNGVLEDMVAKLYPKDGDWSAIDELLAKNPEDVTPLEMEAINQIMMDNVSLDENGDIVVDEEMEELYEHFFEEEGPFNHGYYPKPLVEYIVSYQQEYSQAVANRYAYVFSMPKDDLNALEKMKESEVYIACAVADMTCAVYSMSEWGDQMKKKPTFDITYNSTKTCIEISQNSEKLKTEVYRYNSIICKNYVSATSTVKVNEKKESSDVVATVVADEIMGAVIGEIPVVSDIKDVFGSSIKVCNAYNAAKDNNIAIDEAVKNDDIAIYTEVLEGTCSIVAEKDSVSIRNVVINIDELDKKIERVNNLGYDFDRETLINEYIAFCNGSTDIPNLMAYKGVCLYNRIE